MLHWWENLMHTTWEQPWLNLSSYPAWKTRPSCGRTKSPMWQHWLPNSWYIGLTVLQGRSEVTQASKLWCKQDTWQVKRQLFALCSVKTLWDTTIRSLFPHKLLLQFSAQRCWNTTFFQGPPFKTNWTHHYSFPILLQTSTGECPTTG